jgi:hypothetical protein
LIHHASLEFTLKRHVLIVDFIDISPVKCIICFLTLIGLYLIKPHSEFFSMAKKKKPDAEVAESTDSVTAPVETSAPRTDKPKSKRGRPKGSKNAAKAPKAPKKAKGKRGRPKGSKNKSASLVTTGKRPRGRPPGTGKKAALTKVGLRGIITQIVREEVHTALLQAFKGI